MRLFIPGEWRTILDLTPLRLFLVTFTDWVTRQQAQVVDYLVEENRPPRSGAEMR